MADDTAAEAAPSDAPESTVNSQITDSLEALQAALQQGASDHTAAMADLARIQATALRDFQAVARQQADATIMSATATAAVAKMMSVPFGAGGLGTGVVSLAEAQAIAGISVLRALREASGPDSADAESALARVQEAAQTSSPKNATSKKAGDQ